MSSKLLSWLGRWLFQPWSALTWPADAGELLAPRGLNEPLSAGDAGEIMSRRRGGLGGGPQKIFDAVVTEQRARRNDEAGSM